MRSFSPAAVVFADPTAVKEQTPAFQKYIFVCENVRKDGVCCMPEGERIREELKSRVKASGLSSKIRVSRAGCLDVCGQGPNVLVMPDDRWYSGVAVQDVEAILAQTLRGVRE